MPSAECPKCRARVYLHREEDSTKVQLDETLREVESLGALNAKLRLAVDKQAEMLHGKDEVIAQLRLALEDARKETEKPEFMYPEKAEQVSETDVLLAMMIDAVERGKDLPLTKKGKGLLRELEKVPLPLIPEDFDLDSECD